MGTEWQKAGSQRFRAGDGSELLADEPHPVEPPGLTPEQELKWIDSVLDPWLAERRRAEGLK